MYNKTEDLFGPDFDPLPGAVILHESVAAYDLAPPKIRIIDSTVDNIGFSFKQPDGQTRIEFVISESKLIEPTAKDEFDIWKYTSSAALAKGDTDKKVNLYSLIEDILNKKNKQKEEDIHAYLVYTIRKRHNWNIDENLEYKIDLEKKNQLSPLTIFLEGSMSQLSILF